MSNPLNQPVNPFNAQQSSQDEYKKLLTELQLEHDQKMLAVFNGPEGDALLDLWDDHFLRQPVIIPGTPEGENEMREGRNNFIRRIRMVVNRARGTK